ncbi:MAG: leucine-rich repeat protein [Ruminococcus sp.]|nr:leucine-rich repeat protein [Ruminococcus sp.]
MKKSIITGVLALSMAFSAVPANFMAYAADDNAASDSADSDIGLLKFRLYGTYISVVGVDKNAEEIVVPDSVGGLPVLAIDNDAFRGSNIRKIVLPEGIQEIRNEAFAYCAKLEEISLPSTLEKIGISAFSGCYSLKTLIIPDRVSEIDKTALTGCDGLETVQLPNKLNSYPENLLSSAVHLKNLKICNPEMTMPENKLASVEDVVISGFTNSTAEKYAETYGYSFESIGGYTPVELPPNPPVDIFITNEDGTGVYGSMEFATVDGEIHITDCDMKVVSVEIPDTINNMPVTVIDKRAFAECRVLESIKLPANLKLIDTNAFINCKSLTSIELPASLEKIGSRVFTNTAVVSVDVPASVKSVIYDAFWGCPTLEAINVDEDNPYFYSVDGVFYSTTSIGPKSFVYLNCYPPAKTDKEFDVPDNVYGIRNLAFYGAENLEKVTMSDDVSFVSGGMQFSACTSLKEIRLSGKIEEIAVNTFSNCDSLENIVIPNSVKKFSTDAFWSCDSLKSLCIPSSVEEIYGSGFNDSTNLESVYIMNADCVIKDSDSVFKGEAGEMFSGTIYGYEGSTAEQYAEKYGIKFVSISDKAVNDKYDVNLDGKISVADAVVMQRYLLGERNITEYQRMTADILDDSTVDMYDFLLMKKKIINNK